MALTLAGDFLDAARVLLQDTVAPLRFTDDVLLNALQYGLDEMYRLRPDIFIGVTVPAVTAKTVSMTNVDTQYRLPLVHFITGYAETIDAESAEGSRASGFISSFTARLTGALAQ